MNSITKFLKPSLAFVEAGAGQGVGNRPSGRFTNRPSPSAYWGLGTPNPDALHLAYLCVPPMLRPNRHGFAHVSEDDFLAGDSDLHQRVGEGGIVVVLVDDD